MVNQKNDENVAQAPIASYTKPEIKDHGSLEEITAAAGPPPDLLVRHRFS